MNFSCDDFHHRDDFDHRGDHNDPDGVRGIAPNSLR
jgi:hypothetical protein